MPAVHDIVLNAAASGHIAAAMLLEGDMANVVRSDSPIGRHVSPEKIAEKNVTLLSYSSRSVKGDAVQMCSGGGVVTFGDVDVNFEV